MDLAVRTCVVALASSVATVVFLWDNGLWLMLALIPYGATYLAYRGSVVAAAHYGVTVAALIAINRFALYERMHLELPEDLASERKQNARLSQVLRYRRPTSHLTYTHPSPENSYSIPRSQAGPADVSDE